MQDKNKFTYMYRSSFITPHLRLEVEMFLGQRYTLQTVEDAACKTVVAVAVEVVGRSW